MCYENKKVITSQVEAKDIVPLAKKCLEYIENHRSEKEKIFTDRFMKDYNGEKSKWVRFWRFVNKEPQFINNEEELDKYIRNDIKESDFCFSFDKYNKYKDYFCHDYSDEEAFAKEILRFFKNHISQDSTDDYSCCPPYTMDIKIYNRIARF